MRAALDRFFFKPEPPTSIALFRILQGALILVNCTLLWPDYWDWFSPTGFTPPAFGRAYFPGTHLNVFEWLPQSPGAIWGVFWLLVIAATCLTLGFRTRTAAAACFLLISSLHHRNLGIVNSGDTVMRLGAFFLAFSPAGKTSMPGSPHTADIPLRASSHAGFVAGSSFKRLSSTS
jgi:hypothetical protein